MRLLPPDVGTVHLLPQNPNYSDEEDEVHLAGGGGVGLGEAAWSGGCSDAQQACEMWCCDSRVW